MDGDSSGSNLPGQTSDYAQPGGGDRSDVGSDPGGYGRPRKFVIQSTFGVPRERRSRKSRPCDACRRRKTACIIAVEPPCAFCKSRGIPCQSTPTADARFYNNNADFTSNYAGHTYSPSSYPVGQPDRDGPDVRGSPLTAKSSPQNIISPLANELLAPRYGHEPTSAAYPSVGFSRDDVKSEPDTTVSSMTIVQPALNSPESSVSVSAHTLEDNPGRATYFLGSSAEQDPFVLDAFSYGILSESSTVDAIVVQLHRGGADTDDLPVHFLFLSMGHPKHSNLSREEASDAMETKVWPHADVLVRLYFKYVHPVLPIVSKVRFLRRYATNRRSIPACLRGAVYALASAFWKEDPASRSGDPFPFEQHEIVDQAHTALRREMENPNLFVVQACLLLLHVQAPTMDAMEAPSTFILASQATACAQLIGLHQDSDDWNLEPVEKKLRRKLWWATFMTDCWAAIALGTPPHISESSFTTAPVDIEDMRCDEDVPDDLRYLVDLQNAYFDVSSGARFLEYVKVTGYLRGILDCSFQVRPRITDAREKMQCHAQLASIQEKLKDWPSLLPSCLAVPRNRDPAFACNNCPLHLTLYATKVLLYRALMHPATKAAKAIPDSNLRRWFAHALSDFAQFTEYFVSINPGDLRGFWGRHSRSQLILCGNFLVYLFLMAAERPHIEAAHKMLEDFRVKVNKISMTDHNPTKALTRPTTIRTNSFFAQAAAVMRHGPEASITEPITICGPDGPTAV